MLVLLLVLLCRFYYSKFGFSAKVGSPSCPPLALEYYAKI